MKLTQGAPTVTYHLLSLTVGAERRKTNVQRQR
jgi:hypothetical protein